MHEQIGFLIDSLRGFLSIHSKPKFLPAINFPGRVAQKNIGLNPQCFLGFISIFFLVRECEQKKQVSSTLNEFVLAKKKYTSG